MNYYAIAIIFLIVIISIIVIVTPIEKIQYWSPRISAFSSLAILATIMIFLLNYISTENQRERQTKIEDVEILDKRLIDIEEFFFDHPDLNKLYNELYGKGTPLTPEEYQDPKVQHVLSIILRNIDDYEYLTKGREIDRAIENLIHRWLESPSLQRYYKANKQYYNEGIRRFLDNDTYNVNSTTDNIIKSK